MITTPAPNYTEKIRQRLKGIRLGQSIKIADTPIPMPERQTWYHAARSMSIKVSVKTTPEGTRAWRIA